MTYPPLRLGGLPFEAQMGSSPKYTIQPSNSFEWRKIIFRMITSTGIRHAKPYTLRGGPSTKLGQSKNYDEEREIEPRPEPARVVTPPLRAASPKVRRGRERVGGFEELKIEGKAGSKGTAKVEGFRKKHQKGMEALPNNVGGNLPPNGTLLAHNAQPFIPASLNVPNGFMRLFPNPLGSVTPFVRWIEDFPLPDGLKMPSHIGSYDEKGDPDNFLHLFEGAIRMQKWLMLVACQYVT
ncbi:hypothetical protein Tco_0970723 [Tanacetum coccineum]